MTTYSASLMANTPKAIHSGVNAIAVTYSGGGATGSAGDIIHLAKIPHGARIIEVIEDHSTGATAHTISLGMATGGAAGGGASFSMLLSAVAQAAKNRLGVLGIPPVVSVSDGDPNRYGILAAKVAETGTGTVNLVLNVVVMYTTDGVT
jgi:hypothetical protein